MAAVNFSGALHQSVQDGKERKRRQRDRQGKHYAENSADHEKQHRARKTRDDCPHRADERSQHQHFRPRTSFEFDGDATEGFTHSKPDSGTNYVHRQTTGEHKNPVFNANIVTEKFRENRGGRKRAEQ